MATRAEISRLRSANADLAELVARDLKAFWGTLNLTNPEAARNALLEFTPSLVAQYGDIAAVVSADWYDDLRADAGVARGFAATPAATVEASVVQAEVRYASGALFTETPTDTLSVLDGATARYVLQAGRDTIVSATQRDPKAVGWYRVSGGGCDFCNMLAARGAVYKKTTVNFAAHDHCRCASVPSWDPSRPEADVNQYVASQRTSNMSPAAKAEHNEKLRGFLESWRENPAP